MRSTSTDAAGDARRHGWQLWAVVLGAGLSVLAALHIRGLGPAPDRDYASQFDKLLAREEPSRPTIRLEDPTGVREPLPVSGWSFIDDAQRRGIVVAAREILEQDPSAAGSALLNVLRERRLSMRGVCLLPDGPLGDDRDFPLFILLQRFATPSLDALALKFLRSPSEDLEFRFGLAVLLCRPGNARAIATLLEIVEDTRQPLELRKAILFRLSAIGPRHLERYRDRLRRLASEVVGRVDLAAAACLGQIGDAYNVSLLLEGLEAERDVTPLVAAVERLTGVKVPYDEALMLDVGEQEHHALVAAKAREALAGWFATSRDASLSVHKAALCEPAPAKESRAKEPPNVHSCETAPSGAPLAAGNSFAERALWLHFADAKYVSFYCARIRRLAQHLNRVCEGAVSDAERMSRIIDYLLTARVVPGIASGGESFFWCVLDSGVGDCLGITSLFVALGEEMGLDIGAVVLPSHVLIAARLEGQERYYESTCGGQVVAPAELRTLYLCHECPEEWWQRATKERLLACLAYNRAGTLLARSEWREALRRAEIAIRTDPEFYGGYLLRAEARARSQEEGWAFEARRDFETCLRLYPGCEECRIALERLDRVLSASEERE